MIGTPIIRLAALLTLSATQIHAFDAGADNFASAPQVTTANGYSSYTDLTAFTTEVNEPGHNPGGATGAGNTAWWTWTAPEDGLCTVDTFPTTTFFNPISNTSLAIYTGDTVDALTVVGRNSNYAPTGAGPNPNLSRLTFAATKDTIYRIAIDAQNNGEISASTQNVALSIRLLALRKATRSATFSTSGGNLGSLTLNMTATGAVSGKLIVNALTYPFAGSFGIDGLYTTSFTQKRPPNGQQPLPITLQLDGAGTGQYVLYYGTQDYSYDKLPEKVIFNASSPNTTTGLYPTWMESSANWGGFGTFSITSKSNGSVTGVGYAIDGTRITFSSALHQSQNPGQYTLPVYVPTFKGKGGLILRGYINEEGSVDSLRGDYSYIRPASPKSAYYPAGFNDNGDFNGGTYSKPSAGTRALDFLSPSGDGTVTILNSNNELQGDILEGFNLSTKNKFTFALSTNKPSLKLNTATGQITGSITEAGGKKRTIKGVLTLYEGTPTVRGFVSGSTLTLQFYIP